VGNNYGPICGRLWTKVHQIKYPFMGIIVLLQRHFLVDNILSLSGDISDQVAKLSEITQDN